MDAPRWRLEHMWYIENGAEFAPLPGGRGTIYHLPAIPLKEWD